MTKFLLAVHVLTAIVAIGPVTVAASMFPAAARRAADAPEDPGALATVNVLRRICRVYAAIGIAVPVFGFATASSLHVLGSPWLITAIALTAVAAVVLVLFVLPRQDDIVANLTAAAPLTIVAPTTATPIAATTTTPIRDVATRLAMFTGIFNLLWATVTVLMIVRPGSTTGV
ncbi:MAG TPA: hypothetical protein VGX23_06000 [Actinocrinis sp.]|nr:hypothetical protein [Actinocrinis sp.]